MVIQSTVFSSILDLQMKRKLASGMTRVLNLAGHILRYDMRVNNRRNRHVKGIGRRKIRSLFPDLSIRLGRVGLAHLVVPASWIGALVLEKVLFNTHYLGLLRRA